jgi:two-component system cell cycle response regulator
VNVLIADDDVVSRRILSACLERQGHAVESSADGVETWARLQRGNCPDMLILDWQMPGLDGLEICRRLRARSADRYTYVILVTSTGSGEDAVHGLDAGADDFIAKPFDAEELRARVRAGERLLVLQGSMARSRAYLEAALAHLDSGVLVMDPAGRVVYGNPAVARMSGMPLEQALRLTRDDFVRLHAERCGGPETLVERLGASSMLPLDVEVDLDVACPEHRTIRWIAKQIHLPDGLGELELLRDVTDEVKHDQDLAQLARMDPLTGLNNRRAAEEIFAREFSRARRSARPLSLVLADIDLFKRVNDQFGHHVGDQVLRAVSRCVAACCRATDVAIRWGGEELLIVLPETAAAAASAIAERLRAAVQSLSFPDLPRVTISCGVAELQAEEATLDATVERADGRLYEAKASGRNAVRGPPRG